MPQWAVISVSIKVQEVPQLQFLLPFPSAPNEPCAAGKWNSGQSGGRNTFRWARPTDGRGVGALVRDGDGVAAAAAGNVGLVTHVVLRDQAGLMWKQVVPRADIVINTI